VAVFDFQCSVCENTKLDVVLNINHESTDVPVCCEQPMSKFFTSFPTVHWKDYSFTPFKTGPRGQEVVLDNERDRQKYMKANNLVDANDLGPPPSHQDQLEAVQKMEESVAAITPDEQQMDSLKKSGLMDILEN
jgi:hypothetical protein